MRSYLKGEQTTAIAARLGVHRSNVSLVLKHAGVLRPVAKLSEEMVDQAMLLRCNGLFYRQIAERTDVDTETVRRAVLKRIRSEQPPRRRPPPP